MALERTSSARWNGNLKQGSGNVAFGSGHFEGPYTFASRFESGEETNPEEMIAAAHAACYSMALSADLSREGHEVDNVTTDATLTLDASQGRITKIHLSTTGRVSGIDEDEFQRFARAAKENCPVSKLLTGADEITVDAVLAS